MSQRRVPGQTEHLVISWVHNMRWKWTWVDAADIQWSVTSGREKKIKWSESETWISISGLPGQWGKESVLCPPGVFFWRKEKKTKPWSEIYCTRKHFEGWSVRRHRQRFEGGFHVFEMPMHSGIQGVIEFHDLIWDLLKFTFSGWRPKTGHLASVAPKPVGQCRSWPEWTHST